LGRSAGSAKGKPKIEAYDKDRKKGAGGLITPAKVLFVSSEYDHWIFFSFACNSLTFLLCADI
jgi:hypothetical protein